MRLLKTHPILGLVNSYLVDSPQPSNLSYAWNGGSLLGLCLITQLATGIFLAMHYIASADLAFISVESIMRDVNSGWMIRYIHANTASLFFAIIYLHIARGMWYGSYGTPRTLPWSIGVIILILLIVTAFLGFLTKYNNLSSANIYHTFTSCSSYMNSVVEYGVFPLVFKRLLHSKDNLQLITDSLGVKPVKYWDNLHLSSTKLSILQTIRKWGGIYAIVNLSTGDAYVGSAIPGKMSNRFSRHFSGTGSLRVFNAIRKYGLNNFAFVVIERVDSISSSEDNIKLLEMETKYINLSNSTYNILLQAGNTLGYKHTEQDKIKMSKNYSQERKDRIGSLNRDKSISPISRERIRQSALNRPPITVETRKLLSDKSAKATWYTISKIDNSTFNDLNENLCNFVQIRTVKNVASFINCSEKTVQRALNGNGLVVPVQSRNIGKSLVSWRISKTESIS